MKTSLGCTVPFFARVYCDWWTPYLAQLRPVVLATVAGANVYTAPKGGPMLYETWRRRVWQAALRVAILDEAGRPIRGQWAPLLAEPLPTPHDCRHTYGTRLADAGMAQHDRMALMGHADERSARRYTHSGETRFDAARAALDRARRSASSMNLPSQIHKRQS